MDDQVTVFKLPGFITKERIHLQSFLPLLSTLVLTSDRLRPGFSPSVFSAFKASADWPAQKNATSDVISTKLVTLFTDRSRSCSRDAQCVLQNLAYCDSSPCLTDPALLLVVGFCGQSKYCKLAGYVSAGPLISSPISQSHCPSDQQAGHVTHRPTIAF